LFAAKQNKKKQHEIKKSRVGTESMNQFVLAKEKSNKKKKDRFITIMI